MKTEVIKKIIECALAELTEKDKELLKVNINERTISHRSAIYLEQYFPNWDTDCEYNRDHDDKKTLNINPNRNMTNDIEARTVFPDIIVHKRMTKKNLLVIEIKKSSNTNQEDRKKDAEKLKAFKKQLRYKFAFFVNIGVINNIGNNQVIPIQEIADVE